MMPCSYILIYKKRYCDVMMRDGCYSRKENPQCLYGQSRSSSVTQNTIGFVIKKQGQESRPQNYCVVWADQAFWEQTSLPKTHEGKWLEKEGKPKRKICEFRVPLRHQSMCSLPRKSWLWEPVEGAGADGWHTDSLWVHSMTWLKGLWTATHT